MSGLPGNFFGCYVFDIKIQSVLRLALMAVLEYIFINCSKHGGFCLDVALVALARSMLALSSRSVNPEISDF